MSVLDQRLGVLAKADEQRLKTFAETLIPKLGDIAVIRNRTGLVMLPMRDTAQGVAFHLGEVLVSEAHIQSDEYQGYGMRCGHDLEASMAMALIDLAFSKKTCIVECQNFCAQESERQRQDDAETLKAVETTRVDMETF